MTQQIHRLRGMAYGAANQKRKVRNEPFVIGDNMHSDVKNRDCCLNCVHAPENIINSKVAFRCSKHDRITFAGWTCADHSRE